MTSATIPMEQHQYDAFKRVAAEKGVGFEEWALSIMDAALEDYELAKLADEAYREYLADPVTYTLEEVIEINGDGDLLGDA